MRLKRTVCYQRGSLRIKVEWAGRPGASAPREKDLFYPMFTDHDGINPDMTIPSWTLFGGIPTNAQRDRRHVGSSGGVCKADCGQVPPINPLGAAICKPVYLSATELPNLLFPQPASEWKNAGGHFTTLSRHGTIPLLPAYMSSQLDLSTVLPVVP